MTEKMHVLGLLLQFLLNDCEFQRVQKYCSRVKTKIYIWKSFKIQQYRCHSTLRNAETLTINITAISKAPSRLRWSQ